MVALDERIPVLVWARDPVSRSGIASELRSRPEVEIVDEPDGVKPVAIVGVDSVDEEAVQVIKRLQRNGCPRVVLVVTDVDDAGLLAAIEAGACGLVRRVNASSQALAEAVRAAAAGDGLVPPDLLGRLLAQVGRLQRHVLQPRGLTFTGLTEREVEVLRLVGEGCDTPEIARRLSYSERTIKNIIHDVTLRLNLKNRAHAVAYAVRQGLI